MTEAGSGSPRPDAVGLYIHVPFCRAICTYCAFAKGEYDSARAELWLDTLAREIEIRARATWTGRPRLDTVFLGGGTPSTLSPDQWARLGSLVADGFELLPGAEFTSEANPESFNPGTAAAMRAAGVNRVSLGAQSLDRRELSLLGRIHGAAASADAVRTAREAGFENLSLDLMYGLPEQTEAIFRDSLAGVLALQPDHLSAYCLGLEPGTALAEAVEAGRRPRPDDETARRQYEHLVTAAPAAGLDLYEISNFARPGRACRHNLRYWRREAVIGLGPSAHAFYDGRRWVNPAPLERWAAVYAAAGAAPRPRAVPPDQARFEWVFLRLRLAEGFAETEFERIWGESFAAVYGAVADRLIEAGFLAREAGWVRLRPEARFVSDGVFAEFAPEGAGDAG